MVSVNMAVDLGGIRMKNPLNTASGTFGYGWQFEGFFEVATLGAITTKGCSAESWQGNPAPRMCETASGVMNSVGLQNPGVRGFVEQDGEYLQGLAARGCQVICQVAGHTVAEYVAALELYEADILGDILVDRAAALTRSHIAVEQRYPAIVLAGGDRLDGL